MSKIAIVCGGTGGHIYPALAVAEQFPRDDVIFFGSKNRLESRLIPKEGYLFKTVSASSKNILMICRGVLEAYWQLRQVKPALIFSTGGYVTIPVILAGTLLRIPVYLQEQNILPGKVNRFLSRFAKAVFGSYEDSEKYFGNKFYLTGTPVRKEIVAKANKSAEKSVILVLGGSQGAKAIDDVVEKIDFAHLGYELVHLNSKNYVDDISSVYSSAQLVICRAGASTLSELAIFGIPAVLIPYPYAAQDHQQINAEYYEKGGAAVTLVQKELSEGSLISIIGALLNDKEKLREMSEAMRRIARPRAALDIINKLKEK